MLSRNPLRRWADGFETNSQVKILQMAARTTNLVGNAFNFTESEKDENDQQKYAIAISQNRDLIGDNYTYTVLSIMECMISQNRQTWLPERIQIQGVNRKSRNAGTSRKSGRSAIQNMKNLKTLPVH
jgi:hypothetical protein